MRTLALIASVFLVACAASGPQPDCDASSAWNAGQAGVALAPECASDSAAAEAHLLGSELAQLRGREAQLQEAIGSAAADSQGALQRQLRQLQIDIEAIEGVAVVNGWR
jgi:TolA-binding protein